MNNILTDIRIQHGRQLIEGIDSLNLSLKAALWLYDSSIDKWRLILSFPMLHQRGTRYFYKTVQSLLLKFPERIISLQDISIIDYNETFITLLKGAIKIGPGPATARFTNSFINGIRVDDALVYRML